MPHSVLAGTDNHLGKRSDNSGGHNTASGGSKRAKLASHKVKQQSLPAVLTLRFALDQVGLHPVMLQRRSAMNLAKANKQLVHSKNNFNVWVNGQLRYVEPLASSSVQSNDDSQLGIVVRKRLYDFGQTGAKLKAAHWQIKKSEWLLLAARDQQQIKIMQAYFAVLLADLAYARDNEAMATAYVAFDKVRHRNTLGQVSDVELLQSETNYQQSRSARYTSDVARRISRAVLANTLNRPGQLSSTLAEPAFNSRKIKFPDLNSIMTQAKKSNRRLLALRSAVVAARKNILAAQAGRRPVLEFEMGGYEYQREIGSRDKARASINIRIPLFTGGQVKAEVARSTAIYYQKRGDLRLWQLRLRQVALELSQAIYVLRARRDTTDKLLEYRELSLDRSRALYELDVRKTLGDAMVKQSAARYEAAKVKYQIILTWARLNLLQGKSIFARHTQKVKKSVSRTLKQE